MGVVVLGIQKDRPNVVLLLDIIGESTTSIVMPDSVDPERVFVGSKKKGDSGIIGTMYQLSEMERLERLANQFAALLDKFGNVSCPMCGEKLSIEDEMLVCTNPENKAFSKETIKVACPFRAPLDFFLKEEKKPEEK